MVFGGSDFDSLLHIILVVFIFGGSNQMFVLAQSTFSGFRWWGGGGTSARKPLLSRDVSFFLQIFLKLANELTHKPPGLV